MAFLSRIKKFLSFLEGECIMCYIGSAPDTRVVDCSNEGIQREELYCRNSTSKDGAVYRSCVAMSW